MTRVVEHHIDINHERKRFDTLQTLQPGRRRHRIFSRQHLQRRGIVCPVRSQEGGLESVKEWRTVGTPQSRRRHSRGKERSQTRSQTRCETKSQFRHRSCQWCGETRGQGPLRVEWVPSIPGGFVTCLSGEDRCGAEPPGFQAWIWWPFSRKKVEDVNPDDEDRRDVAEDVVKRLWNRDVDLIPSFGLQATTS